jgi:hypothetical protein
MGMEAAFDLKDWILNKDGRSKIITLHGVLPGPLSGSGFKSILIPAILLTVQ